MIGSSGSGKTYLSRRLSAILGLPLLELDSVSHRGGWNATSREDFRDEVGLFAKRPQWVIDGRYISYGTREIVWPRADTVVWLDPPKRTVMRRVIGRTLRRVATREELWGGLREPWTNLYSLDPERNVIVWAWTRFEPTRAQLERAITDGTWSHAEVHRLTSPKEADRFLLAVCESAPTER